MTGARVTKSRSLQGLQREALEAALRTYIQWVQQPAPPALDGQAFLQLAGAAAALLKALEPFTPGDFDQAAHWHRATLVSHLRDNAQQGLLGDYDLILDELNALLRVLAQKQPAASKQGPAPERTVSAWVWIAADSWSAIVKADPKAGDGSPFWLALLAFRDEQEPSRWLPLFTQAQVKTALAGFYRRRDLAGPVGG